MATRLSRTGAALLAMGLAAGTVSAEDETETSGDIVSGDTAFGQEAGELELSLDAEYTDDLEDRQLEFVLGLEYGITDRLQFELGVPYVFIHPDDDGEPNVDGFDRADLSLLVGLLGEDAPMALSMSGDVSVPIAGRDGPGDDSVAWAASLKMAWIHGSRETFASLTRQWSDEPDEVELQAGMVWGFETTAAGFEVTWSGTDEERTWEVKPDIVFDDVGALDLELSVAFPVTFGDDNDSWGVAFGVVWGYP